MIAIVLVWVKRKLREENSAGKAEEIAGFSYGFVILDRELVGQKSKRKIEGENNSTGRLRLEIERPSSFGFSEWRQRALFYRENGDRFLERENNERARLLFFRLGKFQHFRGPHQPLRFSLSPSPTSLFHCFQVM